LVRLFGESVPSELVLAIMLILAISMLALNLRVLLFLTILALLLPSLHLPLSNLARLFRWAFLFGLVGKGLLSGRRFGLRPQPPTPAHLAILALSLLVLGSASYSIGRQVTLAQGSMMVLLWSGVFLVLWNSWREEADLLTICDTLFQLACLIFVLEAVYSALGLGKVVAHGRYAGIFKNPNGLGTAVAFLGPFVYWKHWASTKPAVRLWCKILGVIMLISLYQSGSRSGVLGAIMCMGIMIMWVHRAKVAFVILVVGVPLSLLAVLGPRLDPTVFAESHVVRSQSLPHLSDRLPDWESGFELFLGRPAFGYGYAMSKFAGVGRANFELQKMMGRTGLQNYHNTHLQLAIDLGVPGVMAFWFFLAYVFRRGALLFGWTTQGKLELGGIAFFAAFLALAGDSFVHGWGFSPGSSVGIVFWISAAAVVRAHMLAEARRDREAEPAEPKPEAAFPAVVPASPGPIS
jgi:O-antigen ligase